MYAQFDWTKSIPSEHLLVWRDYKVSALNFVVWLYIATSQTIFCSADFEYLALSTHRFVLSVVCRSGSFPSEAITIFCFSVITKTLMRLELCMMYCQVCVLFIIVILTAEIFLKCTCSYDAHDVLFCFRFWHTYEEFRRSLEKDVHWFCWMP